MIKRSQNHQKKVVTHDTTVLVDDHLRKSPVTLEQHAEIIPDSKKASQSTRKPTKSKKGRAVVTANKFKIKSADFVDLNEIVMCYIRPGYCNRRENCNRRVLWR